MTRPRALNWSLNRALTAAARSYNFPDSRQERRPMKQLPEHNTLKEQMRNIIEEARMVLPGIQALFGFQTIAVFNQRFDQLPDAVQATHLAALALVVLAIALVMAPAAWHRIVEPHRVSQPTVDLSSRMIYAALMPLSLGIALDVFVVLHMVTGSAPVSAGAAAITFAVLVGLWFVLPLYARRRAPARPW